MYMVNLCKKYCREGVNILFCALLFLLPWQTRWIARQGIINGNHSEFLTVSVYGTDLLLLFLIAVKLFENNYKFQIKNFKSISNIKFLKLNKFIILSLFFIVWNALSIFWASDKILAVQHVAWLLLGT